MHVNPQILLPYTIIFIEYVKHDVTRNASNSSILHVMLNIAFFDSSHNKCHVLFQRVLFREYYQTNDITWIFEICDFLNTYMRWIAIWIFRITEYYYLFLI